jgi:hypothetical protein
MVLSEHPIRGCSHFTPPLLSVDGLIETVRGADFHIREADKRSIRPAMKWVIASALKKVAVRTGIAKKLQIIDPKEGH